MCKVLVFFIDFSLVFIIVFEGVWFIFCFMNEIIGVWGLEGICSSEKEVELGFVCFFGLFLVIELF